MPVGEKVAAERRKQGRTLLEVEAATNIRRRLLELLEEGRYGDLPSPAYVRGYIQNYAHYLGLDAEPLLREFDLDIRAAKVPVPRLDELPERPAVSRRDQVHHVSRPRGVGCERPLRGRHRAPADPARHHQLDRRADGDSWRDHGDTAPGQLEWPAHNR